MSVPTPTSPPSRSQPAASPGWRRALVWVPVLVALPILLWRAKQFMPFMADDSLIVARYAERLIEGHGLTYTDGERVEGYSNLLWTVSVAAIGALGIDILDAARLLGVGCMAAALLAFGWAPTRVPRTLADVIPPTIAAVMFVLAGPIGAWAIGGLEQPMVAALLAWALVAMFPIVDGEDTSSRRAWRVGIPLALLCWTRPDGPLFTAVFAGVTVLLSSTTAAGSASNLRVDIRRRSAWILALRITVLPVLAVATQLCFRLIYYRDWLPNPAYVKVRVTRGRLLDGVEYIVGAWEWMVPALVLAGLSVAASFVGKHRRGRAILLLCCFVAWAGYLVVIGGDIFAARRHWVPLWVVLALMLILGLDWVVRRGRPWLTLVVVVASLAAIGWLGRQQLHDPMVEQAKRVRWHWEGEVIGRVLGEGFAEQRPLLAVTAAGTFPYYSKLPALDMLGLNDRHIARQRPEQAGDLAHDHADGAYVLDREPDLMIFNLGERSWPGFDVGRKIRVDRRFKRDYVGVKFRGYVPHERDGWVFVRIRGRVGMQVQADAVIVPAYLLGGDGVLAQPGVEGGIETVIPHDTAVISQILPLGPGTWQVSLDPPNPEVDCGLFVPKQHASRVLTVTGGEPVRLRVATGDVGTLLGAIRIERVADATTPEPAPAVAPSYTTEPLGSFEQGLDGWRAQGNALAKNPASKARRRQQPVTGNVGKFIDSFGTKGGDRPKGQLTSEPFTAAAGMALSFRIGGGAHRRVGVRLVEGERTLLSWHGRDSEELEEIRFTLTPYAGRTLHIEVFDESGGKWGHVLADEFVLLHPAR